MDALSELRHTVGRRAVYDAVDDGNLINTAKYEALSVAVWHAFVPGKYKANPRLDTAATILVTAKVIRENWRSHGCLFVGSDCHLTTARTRLDNVRPFSEEIDTYAAEGSCPTSRLIKLAAASNGLAAASSGHDHYCFQLQVVRSFSASDISITRSLNRFMDATTLFAFWMLMRDYETLACGLMALRLEKAVQGCPLDIVDLGRLTCLPLACLQQIWFSL